ncbi:hypothetical protein CDO52_06950 [Nocardiopsis gilva YIM 90087]|uniref:Transposase IS4-like domain-containing protein n=1 Tax=Nocardiopsis gilva YIM 90087 TaxID=1235441 RepID=A0A223S345_9ACTN|nr:hypothetical protein CDO52_06950 [Nocardiopsis gilva YIM 90087]
MPEANPDGELITGVTTLLDARELSTVELAGAYAQRWEHESALGEAKSRLLTPPGRCSPRSHRRWSLPRCGGLLLAHYAVRWLMCQAADGAGYASDWMGLTHTVRVVRRGAEGGTAIP